MQRPIGRTTCRCGCEDGRGYLAEPDTGTIRRTLAVKGGIRSLAFTADGAAIAVAGKRVVRRFSLEDGRELDATAEHRENVLDLDVSRAGIHQIPESG